MKARLQLVRRASPLQVWGLAAFVVVAVLAGVLIILRSHAATAGSLYVEGKIIRQDANTRFLFKGYNAYMLQFYGPDSFLTQVTEQQYNDREAIFAKMQSLGVNIVRIPYSGPAWASNGAGYGYNQATTLQRMDNIVASAKAHGIRVYIEDHEFSTYTSAGNEMWTSGTYTKMFPMLDAFAQHFKDEPYFMIQDYNEPTGISWGNWVNVQEAVIKHLRQTDGYDGLIMVDGINYGETADTASFQAVEAYDASLRGGTGNVAFAQHHYPTASTDDQPTYWSGSSQWASSAAVVPVFLEEFGPVGGQGGPYDAALTADLNFWAGQVTGGNLNGGLSWIWNWDNNTNAGTDRTLNANGSNIYNNFLSKYASSISTGAGSATPTPTSSTPAATPTPVPVTAGTVNDTDPSFSFIGSWLTGTGADKYEGDDHYTSSTGDSLTISFTGTQIKFYGAKDAHHGIGAFKIDNDAAVNVDYYGSTRQDDQLMYTSPVLTSGEHTLTITDTGAKNAASTGTYITADRADIVGGSTTPTPTGSFSPADFDHSGKVDIHDLSALLSAWGATSGPSDINKDGHVDIHDLSALLAAWTG